PEHVHTYRITPLSLWNACGTGMDAGSIVAALNEYSKYELPQNVLADIAEYVSRYGKLRLEAEQGRADLVLRVTDGLLFAELCQQKKVQPLVAGTLDGSAFLVPLVNRGLIKRELVRLGYPVDDQAGFSDGAPLDLELRSTTLAETPFGLR